MKSIKQEFVIKLAEILKNSGKFTSVEPYPHGIHLKIKN